MCARWFYSHLMRSVAAEHILDPARDAVAALLLRRLLLRLLRLLLLLQLLLLHLLLLDLLHLLLAKRIGVGGPDR